jgi:hypothetical protein
MAFFIVDFKKSRCIMKFLILLFSISLFHCQTNLRQDLNINVNSYKINAKISESSEAIDIRLICDISVLKNSNQIQFTFSNEANIHAVKYLKGKDWISIPFEFNGKDSLLVKEADKFYKDKKYSLLFEYSFPTGKLNDTLLFLDRGHRWYPLIMDQIASFKLTCEVPKSYAVISSGNLLEIKNESAKSVYVWESLLPVFKLSLIIYNPKIFKKTDNDIVDFYYPSVDSVKALKILEKTRKVVNYFKSTLGVYPYKKLTIIEIPDFPGINTCSGLLMTGTYSLEMAEKGYDDMLILTTAQQWFGAGVFGRFGEKGFFFISLSLPHYLRLMFIREEQGEVAFNKSLMDLLITYKEFAGKENDIPIIDVDLPNTKEKGLILYAKGPFVLSKIEKDLGRKKWLSFLRDLCQTFRGRILTYDEFKKYLAKYDENGHTLTLLNHLMTEKGISEN